MPDVVAMVRAAPELLADAVERLLDRAVASAVVDPLDVEDPQAAYDRVGESWSAGAANPVGLLAGWLASRWATRTLRIGKRFSLPVSAVLTAFPPLALSFNRGLLELRVLASFVVHRLRAEAVPVDPRLVQRLTVNSYCWPDRRAGIADEHTSAIVRLATIWVTRTLKADEPGVRVRDAARTIASIDVREPALSPARALGPGSPEVR